MTNGIQQIDDDSQTADTSVFMLDGRQVFGTPTHGVYIIGGKKVLVK